MPSSFAILSIVDGNVFVISNSIKTIIDLVQQITHTLVL